MLSGVSDDILIELILATPQEINAVSDDIHLIQQCKFNDSARAGDDTRNYW